MKYILINQQYGGFSFSDEFIQLLTTTYPKKYDREIEWCACTEFRRDENVIRIFTEKGSEWCSGEYTKLVLKEIPDDIFDYITVSEYDGYESLRIDWEKAFYQLAKIDNLEEKQAFIQIFQSFKLK
jgi:hypothetical protein